MKKSRAFGLAAIMVAATVALPGEARPPISGEEKLAKLLAGRVAGPPQNCITTWPNSEMKTIDRTAYVFGRGNVVYVNRTQHPVDISDNNIMVIRRFGTGTQLCSSDVITTIDRSSRFYSGNIFLGDFIPYRKAK
nr:hypothetical protein [uncultured Sphingomonas sp.]